MKSMDLYARGRRAVFIDGLSKREAARLFGIDRRTVDKMVRFSVPPGYGRSKPVRRPKLDPFTEITDRILQDDSARPKKQRHTSKRVFERLRDEHDFAGGITIVKDYVHAAGINRGIGAIWGRRGRDLEILSGVPGAGKIRTESVCGPVVSDRGGAPRNPALNWNVEWKNDREDGS